MATERFMLIRCNNCGAACDPVECFEMTERQLRSDLVKRLGWISFKSGGERKDVCPLCQKGGN